jgi:hypothetical protein
MWPLLGRTAVRSVVSAHECNLSTGQATHAGLSSFWAAAFTPVAPGARFNALAHHDSSSPSGLADRATPMRHLGKQSGVELGSLHV